MSEFAEIATFDGSGVVIGFLLRYSGKVFARDETFANGLGFSAGFIVG